ncbi:MAG: histidine kinase, partial [Candidatus Binatia bacterium]
MDRDDDPPTQIPPFLARDWLVGGGVMGQRIRNFDWSRHPLGSSDGWPQSLKTIIRVMLKSRYAMWMGWGPQFYFFCNDAYLPTVGIKESWVLGTSARKVWEEIWHDIGPRAESVVDTGTATWDESLLLFLERSGAPEETYHTFYYSPIPDDSGGIGGMLCVVTEDTERVIGERRLAMLRELGADLAAINTEKELFSAVRYRLEAHA